MNILINTHEGNYNEAISFKHTESCKGKTNWCLLIDHMNKIRFRYTMQPSKRIQSDPSIPIDLVSVEVAMHSEYPGLYVQLLTGVTLKS